MLDIRDQFTTLISKPIKAAFDDDATTPTLIFVIDALDECSDKSTTEKILRLLLDHASGLPAKFFVTSRPEPHIRDVLTTDYPTILRLHEVNTVVVSTDIELYLRTKLTTLGYDRSELRYLGDWPSKAQIDTLTSLADGLFIYASTAYKYISDRHGNPKRRIDELTTSSSKFWIRSIDGMYTFILKEALSSLDPSSVEYSNVSRCISAVICVAENQSVPTMAKLLRLDCDDVRIALAGVHSLVSVPSDNNGQLTTFHASFGDYLMDKESSGEQPWFVDVMRTHLDLARGCLDIMSSQLHFNVAGAQTSSALNEDQELRTITDDISYASCFWNEHVIASAQGFDLHLWTRLENVLKSKFLYWVEVLSSLGLVPSGPARIQKLILRGKVSSIQLMHFETVI